MHRLIQNRLEEVLAETIGSGEVAAHLAECKDCRDEVNEMRRHASMLRDLRAPQTVSEETLSPRPGFYARVLERIEAQRPIDIWQLFFDSSFGRRIAIASMALAFLFSVYLVSSERLEPQTPSAVAVSTDVFSEGVQPGMVLTKAGLPDKDAVLINLVTYREQ